MEKQSPSKALRSESDFEPMEEAFSGSIMLSLPPGPDNFGKYLVLEQRLRVILSLRRKHFRLNHVELATRQQI